MLLPAWAEVVEYKVLSLWGPAGAVKPGTVSVLVAVAGRSVSA